ncbi:hypothetical protein AWU65_20435 [Paenibacillus glucanolyticus]|uniref:Uncharacterized protein n=1 Tax=Paenibacillus glucanolyticus TaxID=59843 RepID=A0A163LH26_9BACL|nr:hypothetical protein [Paenibacillus glucanolyticus]KZS48126.1 hypothetical protein AWU65_20435 [Paenibacillus glucanolyticus]
MSIWSDTPRISGPPDTQDIGVILGYVKDLANTVAKMAKDLEFLVNGNLDANNIRAQSIETKNLKSDSVTTDKLQAGAVTADKITVNELSAITANLGHIISGLIESIAIYGSYISTNRYGYPKVEMSDTDDMIGAYKNANNAIKIYSPVERLSPIVLFTANGINSFLFYDPADNTFSITSNYANIDISTQNDIQLYANSVRLSGWNSLWSNGESKTLKQELDALDQRLRKLGG